MESRVVAGWRFKVGVGFHRRRRVSPSVQPSGVCQPDRFSGVDNLCQRNRCRRVAGRRTEGAQVGVVVAITEVTEGEIAGFRHKGRAGFELGVAHVRVQETAGEIHRAVGVIHKAPPVMLPVVVIDGEKTLVVILRILQTCQTDLAQVGKAGSLSRLLADAAEDGEQNRRQNGDDGDDDQQFNQGERPPHHCSPPSLARQSDFVVDIAGFKEVDEFGHIHLGCHPLERVGLAECGL